MSEKKKSRRLIPFYCLIAVVVILTSFQISLTGNILTNIAWIQKHDFALTAEQVVQTSTSLFNKNKTSTSSTTRSSQSENELTDDENTAAAKVTVSSAENNAPQSQSEGKSPASASNATSPSHSENKLGVDGNSLAGAAAVTLPLPAPSENIILQSQSEDNISAETSQYSYDAAGYNMLLKQSLKPLPGANTTSHACTFYSGLCNQIQRFIGVNILARDEEFDEIVEESITWKDTFGQNTLVAHKMLWDVVHWNTFFPILPQFTGFDKKLHSHLDFTRIDNFTVDGKEEITNQVSYNVSWNIFNKSFDTQPPPICQFVHQGSNRYKQLVKKIEYERAQWDAPRQLEMYKAIMKGALRPHPFLQQIVNRTSDELGAKEKGYMVLHARVEDDMARQKNCGHRKVVNMTNIIDMIYDKYEDPPVSTVMIQFSRELMENRAIKHPDDVLNLHNLNEINKLAENGMWDGRVKVVEAGSRSVEEAGNPFYKRYSTIAGGIVNLFIAIQSTIFVGTEVSTYSTFAVNSRFHRGVRENYFYRPEGMYSVTPQNRTKDHWFRC